MDYQQMTAPCGLDCFNCPMYLANDNAKLRTAISKKLSLAADQAVCQGCRNENGTIAFIGMTAPCNVYQCTRQKGLQMCSDCPDFPCDNLHPYADRASQVPHNTKVFNLCLIRKMGLEKWAQQKAKSVKDTYFKAAFKL